MESVSQGTTLRSPYVAATHSLAEGHIAHRSIFLYPCVISKHPRQDLVSLSDGGSCRPRNHFPRQSPQYWNAAYFAESLGTTRDISDGAWSRRSWRTLGSPLGCAGWAERV